MILVMDRIREYENQKVERMVGEERRKETERVRDRVRAGLRV